MQGWAVLLSDWLLDNEQQRQDKKGRGRPVVYSPAIGWITN